MIKNSSAAKAKHCSSLSVSSLTCPPPPFWLHGWGCPHFPVPWLSLQGNRLRARNRKMGSKCRDYQLLSSGNVIRSGYGLEVVKRNRGWKSQLNKSERKRPWTNEVTGGGKGERGNEPLLGCRLHPRLNYFGRQRNTACVGRCIWKGMCVVVVASRHSWTHHVALKHWQHDPAHSDTREDQYSQFSLLEVQFLWLFI